AHAAGERIGRERQGRQRGVPPVAVAHNAHLPPLGVALLDSPLSGIQEVVQHLPSPLAVAGPKVNLAVAPGSPEVHPEYGVAPVGEPLDRRTPPPPLAAAPGPPVDQEYHWQVSRLGTHRDREITLQGQPIAGSECEGSHLGELLSLQGGIRRKERSRR